MFQSLSGFQVRCNLTDLYGTAVMAGPFQSLSGFQVRCNAQAKPEPKKADEPGFNPYRVFKFVATLRTAGFCFYPMEFQSLSGFQVRCNSSPRLDSSLSMAGFQSLSGFQVRCNGIPKP